MRTRQRALIFRFFLLIAFVVMVASVAGLGSKAPDRGSENELRAAVQTSLQGPRKGRITDGVHRAQMTSASWRGTRATYGGVLTSSAAQVQVTVRIYKGRTIVATEKLALTTKPNGAPTKFAFTTPISRSLRGARVLTAVIAVSGGGTSRSFTNVLR